MAFFEWNDSLSLGISIIDNQHKKLVGLINQLNDAMKNGHGSDVIRKIVDELVTYTISHFGTEEKYFKQFNYAETNAHVGEHEAFVKKVSSFVDEMNNSSKALPITVMNFLWDWLRKHIMVSDKKYVELFKANGLS